MLSVLKSDASGNDKKRQQFLKHGQQHDGIVKLCFIILEGRSGILQFYDLERQFQIRIPNTLLS